MLLVVSTAFSSAPGLFVFLKKESHADLVHQININFTFLKYQTPLAERRAQNNTNDYFITVSSN